MREVVVARGDRDAVQVGRRAGEGVGKLPSVTVVVPAYNEAAIITRSLGRLHDYLCSLSDRYEWELLVVNDGSADDTGALADAFARSHANVRTLHHFTNFNLGQALRYAFDNSRSDYIITIDSDLSYSVDHIGSLLEAIERTRAKIVLASPYVAGGRTTAVPPLRKVASRGANRFLSFAARGRYATLTGMTRAYDRRFLSTLDLKAMDIEINTEILYKAQVMRAKVVEIPAHLDWTEQRAADSERKSSLRLRRSVMAYAFSGFLFRPVLFFTLPGLVLLLLSVYTLAWVFVRTWENFPSSTDPFGERLSIGISQAFADAPHTFVVGGIALILAVQLISLGFLAAQNKRYFEEVFHLGTTIYRTTKPYEPPGLVSLRPGADDVRPPLVGPDPDVPDVVPGEAGGSAGRG